ncbi:hypothetical protein IWW52_001996 [Coemansia sp. RSA 2704]|nr:hypothetical protein IWW52_001996 [Coemansia sp. RSA 2704]
MKGNAGDYGNAEPAPEAPKAGKGGLANARPGRYSCPRHPQRAAHEPALHHHMHGPQEQPTAPAPVGAQPGDTSNADPRNIYVRNLPRDCTDERLHQMAAAFGEIESSKSMIDAATGKCKGYGFVRYRSEEQAQRAIRELTKRGMHAAVARDSFRTQLKRLQDRRSANVYVANLPPHVDERRLAELARPLAVVSARVLRDPVTGRHRGAGFARMADRHAALLLIDRLRGLRLPGAPAPLVPRIADSPEQKLFKRMAGAEPRRPPSPQAWRPLLVCPPPAVYVPYAGFAPPGFAAGYGPPMYVPLPEHYHQPPGGG